MSSTLSWHTCFTQDGGRAQPQGYQPNRGLLPPNFGGCSFAPPFFEFWARGNALKSAQVSPLLLPCIKTRKYIL